MKQVKPYTMSLYSGARVRTMLCCFLAFQTVFSQSDLKVEPFALFNDRMEVVCEFDMSNQYTMSAGITTDWTPARLYDSSITPLSEPAEFDRLTLGLLAEGRRYLFDNQDKDQWFLGARLHYEREIHRDEAYYELYEIRFHRPYPGDRNPEALNAGPIGGYKLWLGRRWVAEAYLSFTVDLLILDNVIAWESRGFLKLGMRL